MQVGQFVTYSYRKHHLLGGALVSGSGVIVGETVVGTDRAFAIKPADGSPVVHVRVHGVSAASKE